jgi:hypothetical protein
MRRKLFTLAAGASAVLCVAVCVLWVRSYWVTDSVGWGRASGEETNHSVYGAPSGWGRIVVVAMVDMPPGASFEPRGVYYCARPPVRPARIRPHPSWLNRLGFYVMSRRPEWGIIVPDWSLLAVAAILPDLQVARRTRRHLRRAARCPACGRDLRATPDRCPECGAVPAAKGAA